MSYTAKSVILDIADNWGSTSYLAIRSVDFWFEGSKITNVSADFTAYATSFGKTEWNSKYAFDTSTSKTGASDWNQWHALYQNITNQRLTCVFDSTVIFDEIRINNGHTYGTGTNQGSKNVKIYISTDTITSTVYDESIANSTLIFDSQFDEHTASDIEDEQILVFYFDGIFPSQEIPFNLNESSTQQISLGSPAIIYTPAILGDVYAGAFIPSQAVSFTQTATSGVQIGLSGQELIYTFSSTSMPMPGISNQAIEFASSAVGDVFAGVFIVQPEISFTPSGESVFELSVSAPEIPFEVTSSGAILIGLGSQEMVFSTVAGDPVIFEFTTVGSTVYYLFTLTGAADETTDIEIPISSFQCRMRSGDPTYLSVVIPTVDYAAQIAARANGTLKVDMAYKKDGEFLQRETIIQADLENVAIDEGTDNQSVTLTGYKTETFSGKTINLDKSVYRSVKDGKIRHRIAKPNIYLRPGDTITVDSDTFIAGTVSYAISVELKTIEISEA